jgi:hypothetical protein
MLRVEDIGGHCGGIAAAPGLRTAGLALSLAQDDKDCRLQETLYHVMLAGRRLGPYDRRTIVGMRVRKTLTSRDVLECTDGARLTVAELLHGTVPALPPGAVASGSAAGSTPSSGPEPAMAAPAGKVGAPAVAATYAADLLAVQGRGYEVPAFHGEVELRVQGRMLRMAGRCRDGRAWKEDRVKFPLHDILHARLQGSIVELGVLPSGGRGLQRLRLDLRTQAAAGELVERLPHTVPWPGSEPLAGPSARSLRLPHVLWWCGWVGLVALLGAAGWLLAQRF